MKTHFKKRAKVNIDKIKVIQVMGGMNIGGAEKWLMKIIENIDKDKFQIDIIVHDKNDGFYSNKLKEEGTNIIKIPYAKKPIRYAICFLKNYMENGPYDIMHCHVHYFSGFVVLLGKLCGIKRRIVHSRTSISLMNKEEVYYRRIYAKIMKFLIDKFSTNQFSVSEEAGKALFYKSKIDNCVRLHSCIDLSEYEKSYNKDAVREELSIPKNSFVFGHVGRFQEPKNHKFILEVAEEIINKKQNSCLLLVGDGPLRPSIEKEMMKKGIFNKAIFTGFRDDVAYLLQAIDVLIMPSLYEGLPTALIEAQAAGIPCVVSSNITKEAIVINDLVFQLDLEEPPENWARKVIEARYLKNKIDKKKCIEILRDTDFDVNINVSKLEKLYHNIIYESNYS